MDRKIANLHSDRVLWMDLEMTGLSPSDDKILEVAAIVTDWDLNEIATFQGIVKNDVSKMKKRFAKNSSFWDMNTESRDSLIQQNKDGKSQTKVESDLISFVNANFKAGVPVLLAGNSIHIDRQFIKANWPKFDAKLHYRMLDVSAWKVVFEGKFGKKFAKPDAHRASDDIRGSIMELQYYLTKLK